MKGSSLLLLVVLFLFSCREERLDIQQFIEVSPEQLIVSVEYDSTAPLAGLLRLETTAPSLVSLEVRGPGSAEISSSEIVQQHEIPLTGLYPDEENQVIYRVVDPMLRQFATDSFAVSTTELPSFFPEIRIEEHKEAETEPGWTILELSIGGQGSYKTFPVAFDPYGQVRWFSSLAWTSGWTAPFEPIQNGAFVFGRGPNLYTYSKLGKVINRWRLSGYSQHHDIIEKPDGNFLVPVSKQGLNTTLDFLIEIDRHSGEVLREWDFRAVLDVDRFDILRNPRDWLHVNSVWYDERDEGLIISAKHQGIFKVSNDNELLWILAPHRGWGKAGENGDGPETADYLLTAVDAQGHPLPENVQEGIQGSSDFEWSWGQHAAMLLPNGNLLTFDNGLNRYFKIDGPKFSRAVVYEIDETRRTIRQEWQYGEERGEAFHSSIISDVDYLSQTGNVLITSGLIRKDAPEARIVEVNYPGQEVVFEAAVLLRNQFSNGRSWGETDIVYRSERVVMTR